MTNPTINDRRLDAAGSFTSLDVCSAHPGDSCRDSRHGMARHGMAQHGMARHDAVTPNRNRSGAAGIATIATGETTAYRSVATLAGNDLTWLRTPKFGTPRHFQRWRSAT
ncbi:MAG: hypothetical protein ACFCVK_00370 [Acidimicrobiales bacterium]